MRQLLLFSATTGYQTRSFAATARSLGIDLILATDRCDSLQDPWGDHAIAVKFDRPETLDSLRHLTPSGVVALGDRPAVLAAIAAERFAVPFHSVAGARAAHDKFLARQLYQAAGLPVPEFFRIPITDSADAAASRAAYPCVLKPLGLSASRGVIRANDRAEFVAAYERIRAMLQKALDLRVQNDEQHRWIQVERYIEGREYALEGIVTNGELRTLALFDKPDPLAGPYFEETIYVTPSRAPEPVQQAIAAAAGKAVRALELRHGPVHAEMRVNDEGVWMLEAAARPIGGLCSRALRFRMAERELSLEELIARHAVSEDVASAQLSGPTGVMMIPIPKDGIYESAEGTTGAMSVPGVEDVLITAVPGQRLLPLPEGSSYLGFIFARAKTAAEVEEALRRSHAELRFHIATVLPTVT